MSSSKYESNRREFTTRNMSSPKFTRKRSLGNNVQHFVYSLWQQIILMAVFMNSLFITAQETDNAKSDDPTKICTLPPNEGTGEGSYLRWYFNTDTAICMEFKFKGVGGNENNFKTIEDCQTNCPCPVVTVQENCMVYLMAKNSIGCPIPSKIECKPARNDNPKRCTEPLEHGPCTPYISRWYFNSTSGQCEKFLFGGCGGNGNNFESHFSCGFICRRVKSVAFIKLDKQEFVQTNIPSRCNEPKDVGPCSTTIPRWYYNRERKKCEQFDYSGCEGNGNNFHTFQQCSSVCKTADEQFRQDTVAGSISPSLVTKQQTEHALFTVSDFVVHIVQQTSAIPNTSETRESLNSFLPLTSLQSTTWGITRSVEPLTKSASSEANTETSFTTPAPTGSTLPLTSTLSFEARQIESGSSETAVPPESASSSNTIPFTSPKPFESTQFGPFLSSQGLLATIVPLTPSATLSTDESTKLTKFSEGNSEYNIVVSKLSSSDAPLSKDAKFLAQSGNSNSKWPNTYHSYYGPYVDHSYFENQIKSISKVLEFTFGNLDGSSTTNNTPDQNNVAAEKVSEPVTRTTGYQTTISEPSRGTTVSDLQNQIKNIPKVLELTFGNLGGSFTTNITPDQNNVVAEKMSEPVTTTTTVSPTVTTETSRGTTVSDVQDVCLLDIDRGSCELDYTRYYFNKLRGLCIRFRYGGCKGNGNNFETLQQCKDTCREFIGALYVKFPAPQLFL